MLILWSSLNLLLHQFSKKSLYSTSFNQSKKLWCQVFEFLSYQTDQSKNSNHQLYLPKIFSFASETFSLISSFFSCHSSLLSVSSPVLLSSTFSSLFSFTQLLVLSLKSSCFLSLHSLCFISQPTAQPKLFQIQSLKLQSFFVFRNSLIHLNQKRERIKLQNQIFIFLINLSQAFSLGFGSKDFLVSQRISFA